MTRRLIVSFVASVMSLGTVGVAEATHTVSNTCFGQSVGISGTDGPDNPLDGTSSANVMASGDGADTIRARASNDRACGDDGQDTVEGADDNDWLSGDANDDIVNGEDQSDNDIQGNSGDDFLIGGNGDDTLHGGGPGNDRIEAGAGDDVFWDGPDVDLVFGGGGFDVWNHCTENGVTDIQGNPGDIEAINSGPGNC